MDGHFTATYIQSPVYISIVLHKLTQTNKSGTVLVSEKEFLLAAGLPTPYAMTYISTKKQRTRVGIVKRQLLMVHCDSPL